MIRPAYHGGLSTIGHAGAAKYSERRACRFSAHFLGGRVHGGEWEGMIFQATTLTLESACASSSSSAGLLGSHDPYNLTILVNSRASALKTTFSAELRQ